MLYNSPPSVFFSSLLEIAATPAAAPMPAHAEAVWKADQFGAAVVTVVIPLFNYAHTIIEALESVAAQTLPTLDLVVVDDRSTDGSLNVALAWMRAHADRFNRVVLMRMPANAGLGATRNAAFDMADTEFVLPLDADNRLRPFCCAALLEAMRTSGAAFAYPVQRRFGEEDGLLGKAAYSALGLVGGPYIDALALIDRSAWRRVGGYPTERVGWEDFRLWCRMAEAGLRGVLVDEELADYRVHGASMLRTDMAAPGAYASLTSQTEILHPWLSLVEGPLSQLDLWNWDTGKE